MDLLDQLQSSLGASYTLERELGGGMSRVFVAEELALHRKVVIKVLPPEMAAGVSIQRFQREIALAARLQHAHIVPLLSAGEAGGVPYYTMPYIEGQSLRDRLVRQGELPLNEAVRILREIASALAYAHEHGVAHRDIKPDNVLLSAGSAMVTDFGVAKALSASSNAETGPVTSSDLVLGTPAYMAPEQASADPSVDHRADIYAFGVLAYEVLTGQPPFTGRTPQGLRVAQLSEEPEAITRRRSNIPAALAAMVMRSLEKRPADRPQTAAEIVHVLDDVSTSSGAIRLAGREYSIAAQLGGRRWLLAGLAIALVAGAALIAVFFRGRATSGASGGDAPLASSANSLKAIAVLPFANVGGDTASEYFAEGMTDELADALARLPGVRVAARISTYFFKGKSVEVGEVGRKLRVGTLVQGSIRREKDRVRVTAALVNVSDGFTLWSRSYERTLTDVLTLQNEIAQAIADTLKVTLSGASRALVSAGTRSGEAHDLYLQAMFHERQYTEPEIRKALALFERAIAKDPNYAAAWSGIALAWVNLADDWLAPTEAYPKALDAVRKALALDSLSADAHVHLAQIELYYQWQFAAAERDVRRAIALDPRNMEAHVAFSEILMRAGAFDSALAQDRIALDADPVSPVGAQGFAYDLIVAKQLDSAEVWIKRERDLDPGYSLLPSDIAFLRMAQGRWADALAELEKGSAFGSRAQSHRAVCEAHLGRVAQARRRLAVLETERSKHYIAADRIAAGYAAVGDRDAAFRWLDKAYTERAAGLLSLNRFLWDPIRDDPRFRALERRIGSDRAAH